MKQILGTILLCIVSTIGYGQPSFNRIYRMFTSDSLTGQQTATTFSSLRVVNNTIYVAGVATRIVDSFVTNSGIFSSFDMSGNLLRNNYYGVIPTNSDFNDDVILVEPNNTFSLVGDDWDKSFVFYRVNQNGSILFKKKYFPQDSTYSYGAPVALTKIEDKYAFALYESNDVISKSVIYIVDSLGDTKRVVEIYEGDRVSSTSYILKNNKKNLTLSLFRYSFSSIDTAYTYISQLRELDTLGNTLWVYNTPRDRYIYYKKFVQLRNGNYLVWGDEETAKFEFRGTRWWRTTTGVSPYLAEINVQQGIVWEKRFDLSASSRMYGFKLLKDSSMLLACSYSDGFNNSTSCIIKLNKNRDSIFRRNFRAISLSSDRVILRPNQIEELSNGDLVIGGYVWDTRPLSSSATAGQWGWLVRTDSLGCSLEPSSCRVNTKEIEQIPSSITAYPNPTHGILTMDLKLPSSFGKASVSMLDLTGQSIINQKIERGQQQIIWQTEQMKEGLYFLILKVDNQIIGKSKIIIQK